MSGTDPSSPKPIDPRLLISGYLEDKLTPQQFAELTLWLKSDRENARVFMRYCAMVDHIREELRWDDVAGMQLEDAVQADNGDDSLHLLQSLLEDEQKQPTVMVNLGDEIPRQRHGQGNNSGPLTRKDMAAATRFVLAHALRSRAALVGGVAAVLLLAVALLIVLASGEPDEPELVDGPTTVPANPVGPSVVATLTAEQDAVWDRRPGEGLYAGQRFTLIDGFAEITTSRGAVAILEAPATVELIDSPNAIRLHAGKLVGVCKSESSKGFLVRTPNMDLVDVGTIFGIDSSGIDATEVHVYRGEVEVARNDNGITAPGTRQVLVAGDSVRAIAGDNQITRVQYAPERFATLTPRRIELPGTGHGIPLGEVDPDWFIIAVDERTLERPRPLKVAESPGHVQHHPNDPATSQWILWDPPAEERQAEEHVYWVRTTVTLPDEGPLPEGTMISAQYMADNELRSIRVNGEQIPVQGVKPTEFKVFLDLSISQHLVAGENTIDFEVVNHRHKNRLFHEVGLRLDWELILPAVID